MKYKKCPRCKRQLAFTHYATAKTYRCDCKEYILTCYNNNNGIKIVIRIGNYVIVQSTNDDMNHQYIYTNLYNPPGYYAPIDISHLSFLPSSISLDELKEILLFL